MYEENMFVILEDFFLFSDCWKQRSRIFCWSKVEWSNDFLIEQHNGASAMNKVWDRNVQSVENILWDCCMFTVVHIHLEYNKLQTLWAQRKQLGTILIYKVWKCLNREDRWDFFLETRWGKNWRECEVSAVFKVIVKSFVRDWEWIRFLNLIVNSTLYSFTLTLYSTLIVLKMWFLF